MAKVISIANNKGGVAKTTTAVNLACGLKRLGCRALLVDMDPQSSATVYLGLDPLALERSSYEVLMGRCPARDAILRLDAVDLLPASITLSAGELELSARIGRETVLRRALAPLLDVYDAIVIDNSPSLGVLTVNSLMASDAVVAPSEPSFLALKGLEILFSVISQVRELYPALQMLGVLITQMDPRTTHHREAAEAIRERYPVFDTVIRRSVRYADACLASQPVMDFAPGSPQAQAYMDFSREVAARAGIQTRLS